MSFQDLPPEIIYLVIRFLADTHPLSIFRLLRVDKRCFTLALPAAKSLVFHTVKLHLCNRRGVRRQVASLCAKLQKANAFTCVTRLIVSGHFSFGRASREWIPPRISSFSRDPRDSYEFEEHDLVEMGWNKYTGLTDRHDECWEPVAGLLKRLPALQDLYHSHSEQFSPCLLQTLHQHRPQCRLHLLSFVPQTIYAPTIDEHEYRLVTSPSLHSISPYYDTETPEGMLQKEAFLRILGLAPNLKAIYPNVKQNASDVPVARMKSGFRLAAIECLRVRHAYGPPMLAATLEDLAAYIDFSALRTLDIKSSIPGEALASWADHLRFLALETLRLFLGTGTSRRGQEPDFYPKATRFLQSLPSLSAIYLDEWHSRLSIGTLAQNHGRRLRKLYVGGLPCQCLTKHDILQLGRYCPLLEKVSIPIRRTQGDVREVALYKALGTIRNLKFLDLTLDVSDPTLDEEHPSVEPDWDDFDNQAANINLGGINPSLKGHIRRLLINTLIDKQLASSIFEVISAAKPQHAPLLERLSLAMKGQTRPAYLAECEFSHLVRLLSTEWTIQRDIRYEHRDKVEARLTLVSLLQCSSNVHPWLADVLFRIWPTAQLQDGKADERPWDWTGWRSFPLAVDEGLMGSTGEANA